MNKINNMELSMKQNQKELLISLVKKERRRVSFKLMDFPSFCRERVELIVERDLCTKTLKSLQGGK